MASSPAYTKWYNANKATFNQKRKERYHADPELRQKIIQQSLAFRTSKRSLISEGITYTVTEAAEALGMSAQTLRKWEQQQLIPSAKNGVGIRRYTEKQVELLKDFKPIAFLLNKKGMTQEEKTLARNLAVSALQGVWHVS